MKKKIFVFIIMFIMVFIPGIFLLTGCGETQKPYIISIEKTMTDGLEDTYTITYSDETTSFFVVTNGKDGIQGIKGESGKDGHTPIITIGPNGNWFIDNIDTKISAKGIDGKDGRDGVGIKSIVKTSTDGLIDTYTITYTDNTTSTFEIVNGQDGVQGIQGIAGKDGIGIELANINDKGNLILKLSNNTSLDLGKITGDAGVGIEKIEKTNSVDNIDNYRIVFSDGKYFDYSVVNGKDGKNGAKGKDGIDGKDGVSIVSILKTSSEKNVDTYTITYSNNETSTFKITNGLNGEKGDKGETGNGIVKIEKENTQNNIDTYKILFTDGTSTSFTITNGTNGRGIDIIAKTSSDGLIDTYTINYTDGTYTTYTVTNGSNGLSAYEIYKIYNPDYDKTEQEWILDLVNGDLATKTYTVSFNSDGGNNIPAQTGIKYAGKVTKPTDPVKEGYEFAGWYYEDEKWSFIGYSVTENITLVAKWKPIVYKVSFETNNHGVYDDISITYDDYLSLPNPNITGYDYVWKYNDVIINDGKWKINKDVTLQLVLTPIEYVITYVLDGGINNLENPTNYNIESENIVLLEPSKDRYYFVGWFDNKEYEGNTITSISKGTTGDKTYYAKFSNIVVVNLNANGGTLQQTNIINMIYGEEYSLPEPIAPSGYIFREWVYDVTWYENSDKILSYKTLTSDVWILKDVNQLVALYSSIYEINNEEITGLTQIGKNQTVLEIPSEIDGISITSLKAYCFSNIENVTEIYVPNNIKSIGERTFYNLPNLTKLYFDANISDLSFTNNGNFTNCGTLSNGYTLIIGKNIKSIPSYFMYNSENVYKRKNKVNSIVFEDGSMCTSIGTFAFAYTFISNIVLPTSIEIVKVSAFEHCDKLTSITNFPQTINIINERTFADCKMLTEFLIPSSVITIGSGAFSGCQALKEIYIPNSVQTIEEFAFSDCTNAKTITIGRSVSIIENYAFSDLVNVITLDYNAINISDLSEIYEENIYDSTQYFNNSTFLNLGTVNGTIVNIGEDVIKIPAYLFYAPNGIPNIKEVRYATNCKIEEIGSCAFAGSTLKTITIPSTIKYLGYRVFCDMLNLETIVFDAKELIYKPDEYKRNGSIEQVFAGCGRNTNGVKFIIGENVESLNYKIFDFSGYFYVTNITIVDFSKNSTITEIQENLFESSCWLNTLILSNNITQIGANAFYSESETTHLNTIYYMGNQTEFANIVVDNTDDGNKYYNSANVYYYSELNGNVFNGFDNYWYFEDDNIKTWSPEKYSITYNLFEGLNNENNPMQFTKYEKDIVLQAPTKENYIFEGWFEDSNFEKEITIITEDRNYNLYAKWSFAGTV